MSIRIDEDQLFEVWKAGRPGFVADGVVSEEAFLTSSPRIAVVLKEVNDLGGGGWDLREFLREGGRPQTWDNVARWIHGIRHRQNSMDWPENYEQVTEGFRVEWLRAICAVNLKKSPGTHTADHASLARVAREDASRIREQFQLYPAELTICGGTGGLFREVMGHDALEWRQTTRGVWWYQAGDSQFVVTYAHPEARVQDSLLHYALLDAINEIMA